MQTVSDADRRATPLWKLCPRHPACASRERWGGWRDDSDPGCELLWSARVAIGRPPDRVAAGRTMTDSMFGPYQLGSLLGRDEPPPRP
jgi:hypothetical protein